MMKENSFRNFVYIVPIILSVWSFSASCWAVESTSCTTSTSPARELSYKLVATYPHDTTSFTQGLTIHNGFLYESTGQLGDSSLRKLDIVSGDVIKQYKIKNNFFAEGVTVANNKLVQLTWKHGQAFVYEMDSLQPVGSFEYKGEGWGLVTKDDKYFISDGSENLKIINHSGKLLGTVSVSDGGLPVKGLNEMEIVGDMIFANVWPTNCIAVINVSNGEVSAWLNLSRLYPHGLKAESATVLNGIAYSNERGTMFFTGKYWPVMYELKITNKNDLHNVYANK